MVNFIAPLVTALFLLSSTTFGRLDVFVTYFTPDGDERGVGKGTTVYLIDEEGKLARTGVTDEVSRRSFELPYGTYQAYAIFKSPYPFLTYTCIPTLPLELNSDQEYGFVRCYIVGLFLPYLSD